MRKKPLNIFIATIMMVVSMSAYALDKVDGVYRIGTADDFNEFATLVNDGELMANAVLTADIDLGMDGTMVGTGDGNAYQGTFDGQGHTITINIYPKENYAAVFRYVGWRAVIQNLKVQGSITTSSNFAAGIAARNRGTIRNCYADVTINSSVAGDATHGGLVGTATNGTIIENCLVKISIVGNTTQNCGGVVGWAESRVNIVNCLLVNDGSSFDTSDGNSRNLACNDGNVLGIVNLKAYNTDSYNTRPAPFCYNNYITNNWDVNNANTKGVTIVPLADLADGKICYQLNTDQSKINWVQRIGTDPFPVPAPFGSGQVYASGATGCNGLGEGLTYSNTPSNAVPTAHTFDKYGICTTCGLYNFNTFDPDDPTKFDKVSRSVLLGSKEDIDKAEGLSRVVNGFKFHMKMVNDIEYIAEPGHFIFNDNDWIEGNFDGDGHALTIEMTEMANNASLFPQRHNGSVENLIMHGKIEVNGQYWGSISNEGYESAVRNVYSDINITSTHEGDNTGGGFFGMILTSKNIENCIYAGTINLPGEGSSCARVGGFAGWTGAQTFITNCAILGHINGAGDQCAQSDTEDSGNVARNWRYIVCENVYVAHPITGKNIADQDKYIAYENEEGIANGELAFLLNSKQQGFERFWQRIGTDVEPVPVPRESGLIYAAASRYTCDGTPIDAIYQNTPVGDTVLDPHEFDKLGLCKNCGAVQEDFMTPVYGWFEISTPEQFLWWSNYASKHLDASAKLMADIDLDEYNETDENTGRPITPRFAQVGSEYKPFYGNFDGQCHTISNLNINLLGKRGCGLISVMNSQPDDKLSERGLTADQARAEEGVYVKDVILDETCSITGGGYTGIVGMGSPWAGHITITGCMNLGNVYVVSGTNGSGMYGCSMGSVCRVTINACGVIGDIHVEDDYRLENASFSGWLGSYAEVSNCYAVGAVENADTRYFARYPSNSDSVYIFNCYALYGRTVNETNQQIIRIEESDISSGKLAYLLNESIEGGENFYQIISVDSIPVPFAKEGGKVYSQGNGIYSNSSGTYIFVKYADNEEKTQTIEIGGSSLLEIGLNNVSSDLVAFQMDLTLPEGISLDKTGCSLSSRITDEEQELTIGKLENGTYRLTSSSLSLTPISGNDGTLLTLKLTATLDSDDGQATISNIRFSTAESKRIDMDDVSFNIDIVHEFKLAYKVDGEVYKTYTVKYGTALTAEDEPTKEGYTFSGWSEIPETMPAHDVEVTGNFTINKYKLTYIVDDVEYKSYEIDYATVITPEAEPTQGGHNFSGWSEIPETMPAHDVEVYGTFSHTLTYFVDGEPYKTSSVVYGSDLTLEAEPTKDGYTFGGWSELPETMPAHDVEVTGRFYLFGDVNTDEEVDVVDVVDVARFVVATPSEKFREKLADLNFDNTVNLGDAVVLVNHIAGDQNFVREMFTSERSTNTGVLSLTRNGNTLALNLTNGQAYTAFQFDLYVAEDADVTLMMLNGQRKQKHQLLYNKVEDGHYRVAALSTTNNTFLGAAGELLSFVMDDAQDTDVEISNIHFFDTKGNDYAFDTIGVDQETGVNNVNDNVNGNDAIYDLQGRKLSRMQRGVNVIGGKKILVK